MVYRGKLSKACAECRAKKTRCDAAKPTCGQCRRAGRACSGYRNLQELRLVDQSSEISSKLSKPFLKRSGSDSGYESIERESNSPESEDLAETSVLRAFPEPMFWIEGNARYAFFTQYINFPTTSTYFKTELQFVPAVHEQSRRDGMLESIISALGLAALVKNNQDISPLAAQKYSTALRQTHLALQTPRLAKSDETMATVLLLGLHELVTIEEVSGNTADLSVHLQGAINLLLLRGQSQLDSYHGTRMYHFVYLQVVTTCLHSRIRIPRSLLKLQRSVRCRLNSGELAAADLFEIAVKLCDILASTEDTNSADTIVTRLEALKTIDRELLKWAQDRDIHFNINKIPIDAPDKSFLTHQDIYTNHLSGTSWNRYRSIRICANEEIINILNTYPETWPSNIDSPAEVNHAQTIVSEMSKEICQSVPFFLGQGSLHDWQEDPIEPPTMYGGATILMPLYFASNPDRISPAMHQWLLQQISRIGKETGIAKARAILQERTRDGLVLSELG